MYKRGRLPTQLEVDGQEHKILSDFRVVLTIFDAYNDTELNEQEKALVLLECLYEDINWITDDNIKEAFEQANWFLNCGSEQSEEDNLRAEFEQSDKPIIDWNKDENLYMAEITKIVGHDIRLDEYVHWWTFLGYFNTFGEGLYSTILNIRIKLNKGKALDKTDREFYERNKSIIDIKSKDNTYDSDIESFRQFFSKGGE